MVRPRAGDHTGQPLDGLRVLDMGQVYLGPYCGLMFAFMGADVVKIEPPSGDPLRALSGGTQNPAFMMVNSGKRGIVLDLEAEEDRCAFMRLVEEADVLVENFRPGTMERLGLGYERLAQANPRLVYGSGKGYAADSALREASAMDFPIQALTGLMSVTGFADGPPVKCGAAITDFLTGVHLFAGILAALHARTASGGGQKVEVAMQDVTHHALASNVASYLLRPDGFVERAGNSQGVLEVAPYDVYPAADGEFAIMCLGDRHWQQLCAAMGRPSLARDARYGTSAARAARRGEVDAIVAAWTRGRDRDVIFRALTAAHVPGAPVRRIAEVARDDDMVRRAMIVEVPHPVLGTVPVPGSPFAFSRHARAPLRPAPQRGEHGEAVRAQGWRARTPAVR